MTDERLKIWLGFVKFILGTVALGVVTTFVNHQINTREIEVKETESLGQFMDQALNKNVGSRRLFAQFFATVSRSEEVRTRWREYSSAIDKEYNLKRKRVETLLNKLKDPNTDLRTRTEIRAQLAALRFELETDQQAQIALLQDREKQFTALDRQQRVDRLLDEIDKLPDKKLLSLAKSPPVQNSIVDSVVQARDPSSKRNTDPKVAKAILKMMLVLSERDESTLQAWQSSLAGPSVLF